MLIARELSVARGGDRSVLDRAHITLDGGELVALEGPSGGGKSTLLWALARMLPTVSGSLSLAGAEASALPVREWRRRVSLVLQRPALPEGTVEEQILLPWSLAVRDDLEGRPERDEIRRELDGLGLAELALDRSVRELSEGQAARVSLLRSLLARPEILLLDEPDASLDDAAAEALRRRLEDFVEGGGGILVVRHHRKEDPATRRVRLARGRIEEVAP